MNGFYIPRGLAVAWLWAYSLKKSGCDIRARCSKQEPRAWAFCCYCFTFLWNCKPHRTGRKQRKLGYRAVELDKTISIKSRALSHIEGKWFDQSHRGSMLQVKGWKISAHVLSYFSSGISGHCRQIAPFFFSHSLSLSLSSYTCYILFYLFIQ